MARESISEPFRYSRIVSGSVMGDINCSTSQEPRSPAFLSDFAMPSSVPQVPAPPRPHLAWRLALDERDRQSIHEVRIRVFINEQGFPVEEEVDSWDAGAAHFLLYSQQDPTEAIGTMRLVTLPTPGVSEQVLSPSSSEPLGPAETEEALVARFRRAFASAGENDAVGAKLGRLAVVSSERQSGTGRFLVRSAEAWLHSVLAPGNGGKSCTIKLGAQMPVQGFYAKLGYTAVGEPFDDAGQPHVMMTKTFTL